MFICECVFNVCSKVFNDLQVYTVNISELISELTALVTQNWHTPETQILWNIITILQNNNQMYLKN